MFVNFVSCNRGTTSVEQNKKHSQRASSYIGHSIKYTYAILPEIASARAAALPGFCRCKNSRPPSLCHFSAGPLPRRVTTPNLCFRKKKRGAAHVPIYIRRSTTIWPSGIIPRRRVFRFGARSLSCLISMNIEVTAVQFY